jgi:hypothetical protein
MRRLSVTSTAVEMGVAQVKQFIRHRGAVNDDVVDIIASDGHYGVICLSPQNFGFQMI